METVLEIEIMKLMCIIAAVGIQMQCVRKYGFVNGDEDEDEDDTETTSLELKDLDTNSLDCEREKCISWLI